MESVSKSKGKILVTGASGYIAGHIIIQLLKRGYQVRGTIRSLSDTLKYQYIIDLKEKYPQYEDKIELVEADLLKPEGWAAAVSGCPQVMHVASPFILKRPKDESEIISPAVDGTLNVLKGCAENAVKKVILTSSLASVIAGHSESKKYDEGDWANTDVKDLNVYMKSKPLAERAAWKFVEELPEDKKFELTTILPSVVLGPPLRIVDFESATMLIKLLNGDVPAQPQLTMDYVDVRDVAKAHILAMESHQSAGKRYICSAHNRNLKDIATIVAGEFNQYGYGVKPRNLPNWLVTIVALWDKEVREIKPMVGLDIVADNTRIRTDLGLSFKPLDGTVISMTYDLIALGKIKKDRTKGMAQEKKTSLEKLMTEENQFV